MINIEHEDGGKKGEFYVEQDGARLGKIQYFHSRAGEINVYHTEVNDKLAGQGVGRDLVAAVVGYARKNGLKLVPTCSYAKKVIEKTPEFQDVLAQ